MPRKRFGRLLPTPEKLRSHRSLRWLGPLLHRPWLWQLNRRSVAAGVGIGVFFGFLVPVLQIAGAALLAVLLRANFPVAAVSTLVSNPLTYAPIFVAAYRVGAALLGETPSEAVAAAIEEEVQEAKVAEVIEPSWWQRFAGVGLQVMLGLAVFAVAGGVSAYFATLLVWRIAVLVRLRRRRPAPPGRPPRRSPFQARGRAGPARSFSRRCWSSMQRFAVG